MALQRKAAFAKPRYALKIEYDGAPYCGWQRQKDQPSVQQNVEEALRRLDQSVPYIIAAGRTDAGVHAKGQVAHVDLQKPWDPFKLAGAVNHFLRPEPIAIVGCAEVPEDFSARFSAVERQYLYRVLPRRAPLTFQRGQVWQVKLPLDVDAMQKAANHLLGLHDFTTFRSTMCQSDSPVKTLDELRVEAFGDEVHFHVRARSFLHNQVRSFVGTLERVGAGSWTPEDVKAALEAADRSACGPVAPPDGLYLMKAVYPDDPFV